MNRPTLTPPAPQRSKLFIVVLKEVENFWVFLSVLCHKSNVHGINYVFDKKLHPFERVVWLGLFFGTCYGAYIIGLQQYERFDANPTVISLERDYRDWNGTLPALTICYHNRVDKVKAQQLIKRLWSVETFDEEFPYFMDYIKVVVQVNDSYMKFNRFANDKRLEFINMLLIAKEVHPTHNSIISSFDTNAEFTINEIITEKGVCYNVNSILSPLISTS
jgi:Amiloride-sensitive sodium channel